MPLPLPELFPDQDYRFHLTLRKGNLAEFFGRPDPVVLAERRRWLADDPARYLVGGADAEPLVAEVEALAAEWVGAVEAHGGGVADRLARHGGRLEPEKVLMARDAVGDFMQRAGGVCFK